MLYIDNKMVGKFLDYIYQIEWDTTKEPRPRKAKLLQAMTNPKSSLRQWLDYYYYKKDLVPHALSKNYRMRSIFELPELPKNVEGFDKDSEFSKYTQQIKAYMDAKDIQQRLLLISLAQNALTQ